MKIYENVDQEIRKHIKKYLRYTDSTRLKSGDDFAVFMNMIRSNKYSDDFLSKVFQVIDTYINKSI